MITSRFVAMLVAVSASASAFAQTPAPPPAQRTLPPPACTAPEHRQFDFWVGRWDVSPTGTDTLVAHSLIEKLNDCVIRENWMPLQGPNGTSVNNYVTGEQRWHQTWVSGQNVRVDFHGGLVDGKMVLTGFWPNGAGPDRHGLVRMTYSKLPDGSVRQHGELSTDHGLTWSKSFDFQYRPSKQQ